MFARRPALIFICAALLIGCQKKETSQADAASAATATPATPDAAEAQASPEVDAAEAAQPGSQDPLKPSTMPPTVTALADAPVQSHPGGKGFVRHLARGDNAFIGMLRLEPGGAIREHRDATEEYIHILEGSASMTIDGAKHAVTAGTTIYMPAGATVSAQNGPAPLVALQVFAGPEPAKKYEAWTKGATWPATATPPGVKPKSLPCTPEHRAKGLPCTEEGPAEIGPADGMPPGVKPRSLPCTPELRAKNMPCTEEGPITLEPAPGPTRRGVKPNRLPCTPELIKQGMPCTQDGLIEMPAPPMKK